MIKGSYRCTSCGLLNVHRYAKLYQGVLYANVHECKGKPRKTVEQEQRLRAHRFNNALLPSLLELSTAEDPRPYPPYPKKRPITRPQDPNQWGDLVEYSNFSSCLTNRPGLVGYVAYDNYDPNICYEYAPSSRGSYRCTSCIRFRKHTIAKIDDILSTAEDPCPYPPYPKKRPITRPQDPNQWGDLVEYSNFSSCLTNRPGLVGYVAYDNYDPNICYEYAPSSRGSYRCTSCIRFRKHTIAKIDDIRRVLQSASHLCHGVTIDEFEALQSQRTRISNWSLPTNNAIEFEDF
uniref:Uncharacterized protein n=1 Tax=Panagrolaimus sp. ES5 TaxID=591445 RepID=A0AC34FIF0_9BILA